MLLTSLTVTLLTIGVAFNNCSYMFKTFGGSEELYPEHRDIALYIFEKYKRNLTVFINVTAPYINNSSSFFGRDRNIGYQKFISQYNETINEVIHNLENNLIWYYVDDEDGVGAMAYGSIATIDRQAFNNLVTELQVIEGHTSQSSNFDIFLGIDNNTHHPAVRRIFYDLLHEVDHTLSSYGHSSEFTASDPNFISMENMSRSELLDHIFQGRDTTYNLEKGFIMDMIYLWDNSEPHREQHSKENCINNLTQILSDGVFKFSQGLTWFGLAPPQYSNFTNDICMIREIPRDADQAGFCSRTLEFKDAYRETWTCEEIRISDLEQENLINVSNGGIFNLQPSDFINFINVTQVDLTYNNITSLQSELFKEMAKLQILDLSNNPIENFDCDTFKGLRGLRSLKIDNTSIKEVQENSFQQLSNLENLELSSSFLNRLESNTLNGLNNLIRLNMSDSEIDTIEEGAFSDLSNIVELRLRNNNLNRLPEEWWMGINPHVELIDLRGNMFTQVEKLNITNQIRLFFPRATILI